MSVSIVQSCCDNSVVFLKNLDQDNILCELMMNSDRIQTASMSLTGEVDHI